MTDSATFTTPEASDEDLGDLLLEVLPPDGSTIGNQSARMDNSMHSTLTRARVTPLQLVTKFCAIHIALMAASSPAMEVYLTCKETSGTETKTSNTIRDAKSERVIREDAKAVQSLLSISVVIDRERREGLINGEWANAKVEPYRIKLSRMIIGTGEIAGSGEIDELSVNRQSLDFSYLSSRLRWEQVIGLLQNEYRTTRQSKGTCKRMPTSGNKI